ncbi:hypothetical protein ACWDV4_25305 [Micromonospora sp. NPDC003197]
MREFSSPEVARAVLRDPTFVVPTVAPASGGVAWLRANVGRFSNGEAHLRRRALATAILDRVPLAALREVGRAHPVAVLAEAMGIGEPVVPLVRDVAQAYQPGTGDPRVADAALTRLVPVCGGEFDEQTAARIGVLVQAHDATTILIARARHRPIEEVLYADPPVAATKRQATVTTSLGGVTIVAGEVVRVGLGGGLAFGAGARRCPGRAHALALAEGARG